MVQVPDLEALCGEVLTVSAETAIIFPGGAAISASLDLATGDPAAIMQGLLAQAAPAMAPLKPLFDIVDALKAVFDCITAIPEAIATLSPTTLIEAADNLAKKLAPLLNLIPQLSVPLFAKSLLDVIITSLVGLRRKIAALISSFQRLADAETKKAALASSRPAVSAQLTIVIDGTRANLDAQVANENAALSPISRLIVLLNIFLKLAGLPCVPTLGGLGQIGQPALDALDATIAILQSVQTTIETFVPAGGGLGVLPGPNEPC